MGETITGGRDLLGFYAQDGYDFMEGAGDRGWQPIASWGRDGWDLGSWPLVVYLFRDRIVKPSTLDNEPAVKAYERACYVEGDITIDTYDTPEERERATDEAAFYWWKQNGQPWVEGVDADAIPDHLRGRFAWARLDG